VWNVVVEDKLFGLSQENECLYVVSSGTYRDSDKKKKTIGAMAEKLGISGK